MNLEKAIAPEYESYIDQRAAHFTEEALVDCRLLIEREFGDNFCEKHLELLSSLLKARMIAFSSLYMAAAMIVDKDD